MQPPHPHPALPQCGGSQPFKSVTLSHSCSCGCDPQPLNYLHCDSITVILLIMNCNLSICVFPVVLGDPPPRESVTHRLRTITLPNVPLPAFLSLPRQPSQMHRHFSCLPQNPSWLNGRALLPPGGHSSHTTSILS